MAPRQNAHSPRDADQALRVFRAAVKRHDGAATGIEDLRDPLCRFVERAHGENVPPEQVLIRVKGALAELSSLEYEQPAKARFIRSRIVSLAITTYYSAGPDERDCGTRFGLRTK